MKYFAQLIIIGVIFWSASHLYPNTVIIESSSVLVIATIAYSILSLILALFTFYVLVMTFLSGQIVTTIILACLFNVTTCYFALIATETLINGFHIIGFAPRFIVAFLTAFLTSGTTYDRHAS